VKGGRVNVLGLTFKENCPDLRNSRVIDVVRELNSYGLTVHVHDPVADATEAMHEYGVKLTPWKELPRAHAIVAAVAHADYKKIPIDELIAGLEPGDFTSTSSARPIRRRCAHAASTCGGCSASLTAVPRAPRWTPPSTRSAQSRSRGSSPAAEVSSARISSRRC
jgi:hypothetical protein